ncbi:MAG: sigma-70 family RNA polymerase sigma factor [Pyrinomonadaceae bacterium]
MMTLSQTTESAAESVETVTLRQAQRQNCARLIKLIATGDQSAFAQLYDSTSGLLFGLLLRILGHSKMAEEALEQVYAEIWKQAGGFDEEREKPLTWLVIIAHRRGLERLHENTSKQPETVCENNVQNRLPVALNSDANISEHQRLVRSAINALAPSQREVLELAYFSGMKESEIALYLGHSVETVRLSLSLAIKKLSALFSFLDL